MRGDRTTALPRILVIDDDEVVLATTEATLMAAGYCVTTHVGAFGASSAMIQHRPDVVLVDMNMPGLSGAALVELMRGKSWAKDARILFYSSSDDDVLQEAVERTGADGYVRKGDRGQLREAIARALGG